jgi:hypothetical protein
VALMEARATPPKKRGPYGGNFRVDHYQNCSMDPSRSILHIARSAARPGLVLGTRTGDNYRATPHGDCNGQEAGAEGQRNARSRVLGNIGDDE